MSLDINRKANRVIGYPLIHSQSPLLHNTVYEGMGINAMMIANAHSELSALIQSIKTLSIELTAVTMPFKELVLQYLDDCSSEVKILKTANTIIQRDGQLYGYNTDVDGIAFAFSSVDLHEKRVLVIGAGGAARAMGYFLKISKAKIIWMNRTPNKAMALADEFGGEVIFYDNVSDVGLDIIINTTPVGLYPNGGQSPLPHYVFNEKQIVFDMVYNPAITALLKQAQKAQAKIISGLDMFIGQGVKQIELLTGRKIDDPLLINELKKILLQHQRGLCL